MTKLTQQNYVVNGKSYFYVCPFLMLEIIIGSDTFVDCGYIRLMSHVWQRPSTLLPPRPSKCSIIIHPITTITTTTIMMMEHSASSPSCCQLVFIMFNALFMATIEHDIEIFITAVVSYKRAWSNGPCRGCAATTVMSSTGCCGE